MQCLPTDFTTLPSLQWLLIGGGRHLRLGGGGTWLLDSSPTTIQQPGGPVLLRCSEITSEAIFGPNLATTLTRTSLQH